MSQFARLTQTEVSLTVSALGPIVYDRERARAFVEWASGAKVDDAQALDIDAVFHTYTAWHLAVQAVRAPGDPYSSDALGRRAADAFTREMKPLAAGGEPWGLLAREIMNTEFDFILRAGGRWMIFEFKIVHLAPLARLPLDEEWQLRRQVLAGCMIKKLQPDAECVDHYYVSNHGGPDIVLDMMVREPTGRHFAAPRCQAELAAKGDPPLAVVSAAFSAPPPIKVRHLS